MHQPPRRNFLIGSSLKKFLNLSITLFLLLLGLELILRAMHTPAYFLPLPSMVFKELLSLRTVLFTHGVVTLKEIILGFLLGSLAGTLMAIAMYFVPLVKRAFMPFIFLSQIFPKVAFAPILLIWFGFGMLLKVIISALMSFFPVMINLFTGFNNVSNERLDLFRSLSARPRQIFFKLYLPSAMPYYFAGLKTGLVYATLGAVVGEFTSASSGLGYLIVAASHQMRTTVSFASLIVLGLIVIALYAALEFVEQKVVYWKEM